MPILPEHALVNIITQKNSDGTPRFLSTWGTDTDPRKIVCNGPYYLARYLPGERIVFQSNPYYWRRDAQGQAQPYIDRVIWQILESTDTSLLQFRSGGLDVYILAPNYFPLLKHQEKRGNFTVYNGGPALGLTFLAFNLNQGKRNGKPLVDPIKSRWFNQVEFRQAVAYAIDRQTMLTNIYLGLGAIITSSISVQSPYYASPKQGIPFYEYNPEKAKALLQSAGFRYNVRNELLDDQGNRVRFTLITDAGNKLREAIGTQIQQDLGRIGIHVDFRPIAFNSLLNKIFNSLDWECHIIGFRGGIEPNDNASIWLSDGSRHIFNLAAQPNQTAIQGREVYDWETQISQLYIEGAQTLDESRRIAIYNASQRLIAKYVPLIYLVNPFSLTAIRNTLHGVKYSALGEPLWNIHELKIEMAFRSNASKLELTH